MPGQNPQRRDTARTLPNFHVVLCIVCFVSFSALFVCICVLYYCHRVATQLQLNISYQTSDIFLCSNKSLELVSSQNFFLRKMLQILALLYVRDQDSRYIWALFPLLLSPFCSLLLIGW